MRLCLFWDVYVHLRIHVVRQDVGLVLEIFGCRSAVVVNKVDGVAWAARLRGSPALSCNRARA